MHSKASSEISPVGLLPDSAAHIARLGKSLFFCLLCYTKKKNKSFNIFNIFKLENKLKKLKNNNADKLTSKDLLSSLNQLKEMYMSNFICNDNPTQGLNSNEIVLENVDKSYLEVLKAAEAFYLKAAN